MEIKLQLFGAFRKYGSEIILEIPDGGLVADLRTSLEKSLGESSSRLIKISRFATDKTMLDDDSEITSNISVLAILPPVSGG